MHELYELKEKLCKELKRYNNDDITTSSLEVIDKLSHSIKNIDKIIDKYEENEDEYSYNAPYRNSGRGRGYNNGSYSRGRGRNAKRDSMGRYASDGNYSKHGDTVEQLREMMIDAPNDEIRRDFERVISRFESM